MSPLAHACACGRLTHRGRCPDYERARNQQPHRVAHRSRQHARLRAVVFARDHHRCLDCGSTEDLTLDYLIPLQDGGTMTENNAATRCRPCNSSAGRRPRLFDVAARLPDSIGHFSPHSEDAS